MRVRISGPNLRDQRQGQFHVHREGCADIKKAARSDPAFSERESTVMDAADAQDVVEMIYADIMAENDDGPDNYLSDFHFAPCTADLPDRYEANPIPEATNQKEAIMATRARKSNKSTSQPVQPVQPVDTQLEDDPQTIAEGLIAAAIADPDVAPVEVVDGGDEGTQPVPDGNGDGDGPAPEVQAEAPTRKINRGSYTDDQKRRAHWITDHYSRTGPDVVKAIENGTLAVLELELADLDSEALDAAFASPETCEKIRESAAGSCKYVTKTNVPRALEAHSRQLAGTLDVAA
jgi:hypothetical protein